MKRLILLVVACFFVSPALADIEQLPRPVNTSKAEVTKTDDQVLSLINQITHDVVRADERLADVETRLVNLDSRVSNLETRQEETIVQLLGFRKNQELQLSQAQELQNALAAAHQKADGLQAQAKQLTGAANTARQQAGQANQMAAQANAQAQQALAHAQAADRAAQPKGPGRLLAALFPRMLGHQ